DRPNGERGTPPSGAHPPARREVRHERDQERWDQEQEPDRGLEPKAPPPPAPPAADAAGDAAGLAAADGPGVAGAADWRPSEVIVDGDPGAMSLSLGSNRSTAKRTGAFGSAGGALGTGVAVAPGARLAGAADTPGVAV